MFIERDTIVGRCRTLASMGAACTAPPHRQCGTAAIEFAIVFSVFFALFWGVVSYGFIFAAQQTLTLAAENGARAALHYQNQANKDAAIAARKAAAKQAAENSLAWLEELNLPKPFSAAGAVKAEAAECSYNSALICFAVSVTYPYEQRPLIPPLPVLGLIAPKELKGEATMQFDADSLVLKLP